MSSMAKIFVVVNLVLAVATFGAAAILLGAQDDYRKAVEKAEADYKQYRELMEGQVDTLNDQLNSQQRAAQDAITSRNQAQARNETLTTQLAEAKQTVDQLKGSTTTMSEKLAELTNVIQQEKDYREQLNNQMQEAVQSKLEYEKRLQAETQNRARLEVTVGDLNSQVQELTAQLSDTQKQLRDTKFMLDKYREVYPNLVSESQGEDGRVLEVKDNIVVISVGRDDGVRNGDTYHLRRGSNYVGQMTVTRVEKDLAVGRFDTQFTGSGGMPQVGDIAYVSNP